MGLCKKLVAVGALAVVVAAATVTAGSSAAVCSKKTPADFKAGKIKIAVVRQLNAGDVYQEWIRGVKKQATKLKTKLTIYDANGDNAKQALYMQQAIDTKPDAILIGWGFGSTLAPLIKQANSKCIPVVTYYVQATPGPMLATVDQGDALMMKGIVNKMVADMNGEGELIYVYVSGYEALDNRDKVWKPILAANPKMKVVATIGVVNANTASQVADQAKAALLAHPNVKAILAPYDEFTKGAALAITELNLGSKVKTYGMDISTADIGVMAKAGSPWVVTATTDQENVGAVALRTTAQMITGEAKNRKVVVTPLLVTQASLRAKKVTNIAQLSAAFPRLRTPKISWSPWMG